MTLEILGSSEMFFLIQVAVTVLSGMFVFLFFKRDSRSRNLPNGSFGLPVVGESLSFYRALKNDNGVEWLNDRVSKYGPVFKTSLVGCPTIVITGLEGNKFVFSSDVLPVMKPKYITGRAGKSHPNETRFMLIKGATVSFLKPDSLKNYVKHMDEMINTNLLREIRDNDIVTFVPMIKRVTFNVACSILFGIDDNLTKEALLKDFTLAFQAIFSIPVNFPGTSFRKGILARSNIIKRMTPIVSKKREELMKGNINQRNDIITSLLALRDEDQKPVTEEEIMDHFIMLVFASHDTSAMLLSLMFWKLSKDPETFEKVREEQMRILSERGGEGHLTWGEIQKMKYTWRVAQELMRIIPPAFFSFRRAVKDTSFKGYDIPKGWQVCWVASATHMDRNIFEDPTTFDPSRFETSSKPIPPYAYIPFGAGTHMCIGSEFGRVETLTVVHNFVTKFEWSLVHPDEIITRRPLAYPSMGLPMKLKLRTI